MNGGKSGAETRYRLLLTGLALFATVFAATLIFSLGAAFAQTMCIPPAVGVYSLPGAPQWWYDGSHNNEPPVGGFDPTDPLWDPRWHAAFSTGYGGGTTNDARFTAITDTENGVTYLYVSWFVNVAPTFSPQNTSVYIGLSPGGQTTTATVIQATFNGDTGAAVGSSDGAQANSAAPSSSKWTLKLFQGANSGSAWSWTTPASPPAWFNDTATEDSFQNTARAWANPGGNHQWAVNLRIPLGAAGVNVGNTSAFKIWFYIQPDLTVTSGSIGFLPYTWPKTTGDVTTYVATESISGLTFPDPNDANPWGAASLQSPQGQANCENGIALGDDDIGTVPAGGNPSSYINPWGPNTFYANPSNYGPAVAASAISAQFRISNWGSNYTSSATSWQDLPFPSAELPIVSAAIAAGTPASPTQASLPQTTLAANLDFTGVNAGSPPGLWALHCALVGQSGFQSETGPVPGDAACGNAAPTEPADECILVSLTGAGVVFDSDSAYRNMDIVSASNFGRSAAISIKGLPPTGTGREVYLYLETRNMPAFPTYGTGQTTPPPSVPRGPKQYLDKAKLIPGSQANSFDQTAATMPTYVVHAYYNTGKTVKMNGKTHELLQPLASFGYFVQHSGLYFGWQPSIEGATKIAPNLFKLHIHDGGKATIGTHINTIDLTTWWIWLIFLAILAAFWLLFRLVKQLV
jgi:hypothetical protein